MGGVGMVGMGSINQAIRSGTFITDVIAMIPERGNHVAIIIVVCAMAVSTGSLLVAAAGSEENKIDGGAPCESAIFCQGELLNAMQLSIDIFKDSKEFVDRPLKASPEEVLKAFKTPSPTGRATREQLNYLLARYFAKVGDDLEKWIPEDWTEPDQDSLLTRIKDGALREFAFALHGTWKDLGRKTAASVKEFPDRHSLLHLPHPFIVHANGEDGRTREQHYWESYWTIHGLLISEMYSTAKGMILNFASLIDRFGYVPMGNRMYYQNRPHPPLLAAMVHLYWHHVKSEANKDAEAFIKTLLPVITKEYRFWMTSRVVDVVVDGKTFTLNRYKGTLTKPRPESYREDLDNVKRAVRQVKDLAHRKSAEEKVYSNIAGASESGWEFSTRWFDKPSAIKSFGDIRTEDIIPVDLNAFLCLTEKHLAFFYDILADDKTSKEYSAKAVRRGNAIRDVFWNATHNMWRDYDLLHRKQREDFYMSSLTPLFAACSSENVDVMSPDFLQRVIGSADVQKLLTYPGGMPASFINPLGTCESCQWDLPNFWPPLALFLIEPLSRVPEMFPVARNISQKVITALYREEATMFEKYDVERVGMYGTNSEYTVMRGYSPTNGAVLRILEIFPKLNGPLTNEVYEETEQADHHPNDFSKNEYPSKDRQMALKSSSPVHEVPSPAPESKSSAFLRPDKTNFPDKPRPTEEDRPTISVKRVRMDSSATVAPSAVPAVPAPTGRLSKDPPRDGAQNCQSSLSISMLALLVCVIAMLL
ncbi:Trehalase [Hypsibius exemplaris]|uniref:Trehalase n=1 Tax=Hypsibius exemplaris TaxID=2072580 RepID=A0A9X6NE81_HYPEX|nr:Trehalase [Hypsibius exemplaris]